jgi:glycosyltransferase involved in cell wall biosynthesis
MSAHPRIPLARGVATALQDAPRLRVAWVAPFDLRPFAHVLDSPDTTSFHNSPWLTNGARALSASGGVDLHVVTYDKRVRANTTVVDEGITFHLLRPPVAWIPRAAVAYSLDLGPFQRALERIAPDVVHGHGTENIFSYAAVRSGFPHVISMQALVSELVRTYRTRSRLWYQHSVVRHIERYTIRRSKLVFVEAPFLEGFVKRINPAAEVRVAGNIVSAPFHAVRRPARVSSAKIMFVGRLTEAKGIGEAVAAFHRVAASFPEAALHIVGEGRPDYVAALGRAIEAGAGRDRIVLRGYQSSSAIAAEYADAAMLVLPTHYDTSPNVVSEAMIAGVPVIAARTGGLPYMLDEGAAGLLVPPRDASALAEAMSAVLGHPHAAAARAERARVLASDRYGAERYVERMLDAYRSVALGAAQPAR